MPRSDNKLYDELQEMLKSNQSLLTEIDKLPVQETGKRLEQEKNNHLTLNKSKDSSLNQNLISSKPSKNEQRNLSNDSVIGADSAVSERPSEIQAYPNTQPSFKDVILADEVAVTLDDIAAVDLIDLNEEVLHHQTQKEATTQEQADTISDNQNITQYLTGDTHKEKIVVHHAELISTDDPFLINELIPAKKIDIKAYLKHDVSSGEGTSNKNPINNDTENDHKGTIPNTPWSVINEAHPQVNADVPFQKLSILSIIKPLNQNRLLFINEQNQFKAFYMQQQEQHNEDDKAELDSWITLSSIMMLIWFFVWFNQNSINTYFQQKYHKQSPIELLDTLRPWHYGQVINFTIENFMSSLLHNEDEMYSRDEEGEEALVQSTSLDDTYAFAANELPYDETQQTRVLDGIKNDNVNIEAFNTGIGTDNGLVNLEDSQTKDNHPMVQHHRSHFEFLTNIGAIQNRALRQIEVLNINQAEDFTTDNPYQVEEHGANQLGYILENHEKVFFIGDSLMQGVAPYVMNRLKKNFNVDSINLSKQSTGLTYTKSFNWLETIDKTLANNPDIGLFVIMMGANDPYAMRVAKGEPYLKFQTEAWDNLYLSRIEHIYQLAAKHNIGIIWVGAPLMKKEDLSNGVMHLNTLYQKVSQHYGGIYLDSNIMFGYKDQHYDISAIWQGNNVKVRANDGVHFTPTGQKIIAEYILSLIGIKKILNEPQLPDEINVEHNVELDNKLTNEDDLNDKVQNQGHINQEIFSESTQYHGQSSLSEPRTETELTQPMTYDNQENIEIF